MERPKSPIRRCAIYTRKSSEEPSRRQRRTVSVWTMIRLAAGHCRHRERATTARLAPRLTLEQLLG